MRVISIQQYIKAESLEQAYELNQKKSNLILGGMMWSRLGNRHINTAIDLSGLGLDTIEEREEEFILGCMCSLHQMESHIGLNQYFQGAFKECMRGIVGVQFRNMATVGGSVYGRFGFSDIITLLLVLNASVELYQKGIVSLKEFVEMKRDNDILVRVHIPKNKQKVIYFTQRNSATDLPVLTTAASKEGNRWFFSIGARPATARVWETEIKSGQLQLEQIVPEITKQFIFQSNTRASGEYRQHLAAVYLKRAIEWIAAEEELQ